MTVFLLKKLHYLYSAGILGPYGGPTLKKLQHLVLNAHSLPLSVQNEIPEEEEKSYSWNLILDT